MVSSAEKDKFIKFEGCYHGHSDSFLIKAGSGAATFGDPNSPGVTKGTAQDTLLARYNDIGQVKELFSQNEGQIAAVIVEPVAGNMGCVLPENDFLPKLRQKRVLKEIRNDMKLPVQMNRLLQGDVGSGKTMVALLSMLIAFDNGFQSWALMAPTEILAQQHFMVSSRSCLYGTGIEVKLINGSTKGIGGKSYSRNAGKRNLAYYWFDTVKEFFPVPDYDVVMLHGKMKPDEKDAAMQYFASGKAQIMWLTTVIESRSERSQCIGTPMPAFVFQTFSLKSRPVWQRRCCEEESFKKTSGEKESGDYEVYYEDEVQFTNANRYQGMVLVGNSPEIKSPQEAVIR
ncbi:hypothetical protein FQR65_LT19354 [Abscondita terminalis]|nr:hypothetical protein FQR65_LT19354 [Abscondita terminalis]